NIQIIPDPAPDGPQTVTLTLTNPQGADIGPPNPATLTIDDPTVIQFDQPTTTVSENAGLAAVQVDRTGDLSPTSTVWRTTSDGTAVAGQDSTATRYIVTFNPGVSTQFVQVPILNDNLTDGTEDFTLTLYNPTNAELGTTYANLVWVADPVRPATIQFADS